MKDEVHGSTVCSLTPLCKRKKFKFTNDPFINLVFHFDPASKKTGLRLILAHILLYYMQNVCSFFPTPFSKFLGIGDGSSNR